MRKQKLIFWVQIRVFYSREDVIAENRPLIRLRQWSYDLDLCPNSFRNYLNILMLLLLFILNMLFIMLTFSRPKNANYTLAEGILILSRSWQRLLGYISDLMKYIRYVCNLNQHQQWSRPYHVHPSVCSSMCPYVSPSICPFVRLCVRLSVRLSFRL